MFGHLERQFTIPGLLTRYFFGESSPCYAYCFAIRDRLFLFRARFAARHSDFVVSLEQRYYLSSRSMRICASPSPIGNRCKASCLHQFSRIDLFCESCSTVPCYVRLDFPRRKEYNCQIRKSLAGYSAIAFIESVLFGIDYSFPYYYASTKPKNRPRNGQVRKPGKLRPAVKCLRCRANMKYGGRLTAA